MKELTYEHYLAWAKKFKGKPFRSGVTGAGEIWPEWEPKIWGGRSQDDQLLLNYETWLSGGAVSYLLPEYFASLPSLEEKIIEVLGDDYL